MLCHTHHIALAQLIIFVYVFWHIYHASMAQFMFFYKFTLCSYELDSLEWYSALNFLSEP